MPSEIFSDGIIYIGMKRFINRKPILPDPIIPLTHWYCEVQPAALCFGCRQSLPESMS